MYELSWGEAEGWMKMNGCGLSDIICSSNSYHIAHVHQ